MIKNWTHYSFGRSGDPHLPYLEILNISTWQIFFSPRAPPVGVVLVTELVTFLLNCFISGSFCAYLLRIWWNLWMIMVLVLMIYFCWWFGLDDYGFGFDEEEFWELVGLSLQTAFCSKVTFLPSGHFGIFFMNCISRLVDFSFTFYELATENHDFPNFSKAGPTCVQLWQLKKNLNFSCNHISAVFKRSDHKSMESCIGPFHFCWCLNSWSRFAGIWFSFHLVHLCTKLVSNLYLNTGKPIKSETWTYLNVNELSDLTKRVLWEVTLKQSMHPKLSPHFKLW